MLGNTASCTGTQKARGKHRTYRKHQRTAVKVPMALLMPYKDLRMCLCKKARLPVNQEIASHPSVVSRAVRGMLLERHKEAQKFPAASRFLKGIG